MSKFYNTYSNTNQNHPLQQNSQNFLSYKKYVSIHSEDRDAISYPSSCEFEIELPEDITNISTMKLCDWAFPSNYDTFSVLNSNVTMLFKFVDLYNPAKNGYDGDGVPVNKELEDAIYDALAMYNSVYTVVIEEGFYVPTSLAVEITNKFNDAVSKVIINYLNENNKFALLNVFTRNGCYSRFAIVYNNVSQKIWFGNQSDSFEILNEDIFLTNSLVNERLLCKKTQVPDFSNWGLPGNLGFTRCNVTSNTPLNLYTDCSCNNVIISNNYIACNNYIRFYYGDVLNTGDNGYWLTPATDPSGNILPGATVQFVECPHKINIFGPSYIYMEIFKYNCIDETQPYNISRFTLTTNETNGIVNSAFAKIPIVSTPTSQYYDGPSNSYKFFDPPVERIRRLKFRLRYHNGELVNFSNFEYSFTLEFSTLLPMINRAVNISTF